MEVPTTAAYVICVSIAGPALIQHGSGESWAGVRDGFLWGYCSDEVVGAGFVGCRWNFCDWNRVQLET